MTVFKVSAQRVDPYKNFKFRLLWATSRTPVAGFSKVTPLKRSVAPAQPRREARNTNASRTGVQQITLERGVTHDRQFLEWTSKSATALRTSGRRVRRELWIEVRSARGRPARRYKVSGCRVSELRQRGDGDTGASGAVIDRMTLEHQGSDRDPLAREG